MPYRQLVKPNLSASRPAGWCLAFAQDVYGAPVRYRSAWDAWQAIPDKKYGALPDVSVCVWMSHWGTYQGEYANWGHVVAYIPGRGFLSSPARGVGQQWFGDLPSVERAFNAKTVGWSESINGLQVVEWYENPVDESSEDMKIFKYKGVSFAIADQYIYRSMGPGTDSWMTTFYGQAKNVGDENSARIVLKYHGMNLAVLNKIMAAVDPHKDDIAWSVERGFFNPDFDYVPSGGSVDLSAVAKAVNDDVAVRMAK